MNRRVAGLVLALALLVVLAGVWWVVRGRGDGEPGAEDAPPAGTGKQIEIEATLYFSGPEGLLVAERRRLPTRDDDAYQVWSVARAVLSGPEGRGLARTFPPDVRVGPVVIGPEGAAYVDLRAQQRPDPPPAGSTEEQHMVYSLVNSIVDSVPAVESVVLLWNGSQRQTFSGHLDTGRPLGPNRQLVAR
jgi:hypothetical protein